VSLPLGTGATSERLRAAAAASTAGQSLAAAAGVKLDCPALLG
jgi:hypothetical protein